MLTALPPPLPPPSEVYVVGRGFKGVTADVLDALKARLVHPEDIFADGCTLFPRELLEASGAFMAQAKLAAKQYADWQVSPGGKWGGGGRGGGRD